LSLVVVAVERATLAVAVALVGFCPFLPALYLKEHIQYLLALEAQALLAQCVELTEAILHS
jgi:hypothetical protein